MSDQPRKANLEVNEQEAAILTQLLDLAVRAQGLRVSHAALIWQAKLEQAFPPVAAAPAEKV